jgi:hypothetical protein
MEEIGQRFPVAQRQADEDLQRFGLLQIAQRLQVGRRRRDMTWQQLPIRQRAGRQAKPPG